MVVVHCGMGCYIIASHKILVIFYMATSKNRICVVRYIDLPHTCHIGYGHC
jgi:hypothetical protein